MPEAANSALHSSSKRAATHTHSVAARKRITARSTASKLKRARAALASAKLAADAAAKREKALAVRLARARLGLLALGLSTFCLAAVLVWSLWRWRSACRTSAALASDLRRANHALKHLDQLNDQLACARREIAEHDRRRQNQDLEIGAPTKTPQLDASTKRRVSARMQLETLDAAATESGEAITSVPLVNSEEIEVLRIARAWALAKDLEVFVQVGMGGFLKEEDGHDGRVLATYNSKRSDFVVCDCEGNALFVIEHHGGSERYRTGHFQGDWADRDRVKRRVLNMASLGLVVTRSGWTNIQIEPLLDQALRDPAAAIPVWPEPAARRWSRR
jgi:hypothetical protein